MFFAACDRNQQTVPIEEFKEGDHQVLRTGNPDIIVPSTKDELDRILHLSAIKDYQGITNEVVAGKALIVKVETKIIVITTSYTTSEIRIESGAYNNFSGWVPSEFIKQ